MSKQRPEWLEGASHARARRAEGTGGAVWCLENTERGPGSWSTVSKGEWYHTRSEGEAEARWYRVRRPWQGIWNLLGHDGKQQVEFRQRNVLMRLTLSEHPLTAVGKEWPQERQPTAQRGCHSERVPCVRFGTLARCPNLAPPAS